MKTTVTVGLPVLAGAALLESALIPGSSSAESPCWRRAIYPEARCGACAGAPRREAL